MDKLKRYQQILTVAFHARIHEHKVWIEWDGTEPSLTEALIEAGIAVEDIVLGYYRPESRELAEVAAGQ